MSFTYMTDFMKEFTRYLTEKNYSNAKPLETSFSYFPDEDMIMVTVCFHVENESGDTEMLIGKSSILTKYLTQYSRDYIMQQVIGDIIVSIEEDLLSKQDGFKQTVH